jgi:Mg-chelatase subunit ChlD
MRFNVIEFNSTTSKLFASPHEASDQNLDAARRFVDRLKATGGTEMAPALRAALESDTKEGYLRQIVFHDGRQRRQRGRTVPVDPGKARPQPAVHCGHRVGA